MNEITGKKQNVKESNAVLMEERIVKEKKLWDKIAGRYDTGNSRYVDAYRMTIEKAIEAISDGDAVLEIGCGTGIVTLGIANSTDRIIGWDISENMIHEAKKKAGAQSIENVEFFVGDGYNLPYEDGSFDVVLLCNVLHFLKEPASQLKEAHRLLREGGALVTVTDCYGEPARFSVQVVLWLQTLSHRFGSIPYMTNFRKRDLRSLIETSGFEILEDGDFYEDPINYYIRARKV